MAKNYSFSILSLIFINIFSFAQESNKEFVLSVCIDGVDKLHIKAGKMYWEHISDIPPGLHDLCKTETKVDDVVWKEWNAPFVLDFNTDSLLLKTNILQKHEFSKLIQSPSDKNNWETIWSFSDPSNSPHQYKVSFRFSAVALQRFIPNNISFGIGNAILTPKSLIELDKIYIDLAKSGKTIEILGYTDNAGKTEDNLKLSQERAKTVYAYLLSKGIDPLKMSFKGFGDNHPILPNNNEKNKAKNRRVEIKIVG